METKSEQFRDALDDAREIVDRAKVQDRDLTAGEKSKVDRLIAKAERLKGDLKDEALVGRIDELLGGGGGGSGDGWVDGRSRKTLWECLQAVGGAKTLATTPSVAVPTDFLYPPGPNEGPGGSPIFDSFPQKRGSGGSASYLTQSGDVPAAAVAPGTDKPVGAWDLAKQTEDYVTVATLSPPVSTSLFKDDPTVVGWTPTRRATSSAVCWPSHAKMILARRAARCSDVAARTLRWSSARTPSAIVTVIGGRPRRATLPQDHRVDRRATPLRPNARSPRSLPVNNGRQAIDLPPVSASQGAFDFRPSFPAGSADRTTSQACRIRPG